MVSRYNKTSRSARAGTWQGMTDSALPLPSFVKLTRIPQMDDQFDDLLC